MTLKKRIIEHVQFRLRTIDEADIEDLRLWKNQNKNSFFLRTDISPKQQSAWYIKYLERESDWMFIVEQKITNAWEKIGCMGFRLLLEEECVDAYNIIRFKKIEPSYFTMSDVFLTMLLFADQLFDNMPIRCKVLSDNPAIKWYERNGFVQIDSADNYVLMQLDKGKLDNLKV